MEQAAALSRDGHFVAFLSDRDGQMDVWVTQVGSGQFHNLTHGSVAGTRQSVGPNLGFSPDGSWSHSGSEDKTARAAGDIGVWAVPTLGGQPRPYLEGVAEFDWSRDGSRLAYHTPGPGDPLYRVRWQVATGGSPIFTAPAGLHCSFSAVGARREPSFTSSRARCQTNWISGAFVPAGGTSRADYVAQCACKLSGPFGSANA